MRKNRRQHLYRYALLLVAAGSQWAGEAEAQAAPEVPRLVVNIVIDQLRSDYLEAFSPLYGSKGFARLMHEGTLFTNAEYPFHNPDRASATACLMSGTVPYGNGIVGQTWMDRSSLTMVDCVDDKRYSGQATAEHTSPQNLAVSTITDELKVSTEGAALVYAISPFRDAAVFTAGHAADGCFWLNDFTGQWCTSSYYDPLPTWLGYYNTSRNLANTIGDIVWEPSNDLVGNYSYFAARGLTKPFRHTFTGYSRFNEFKASAMVNEEVTRFALHCLRNSLLGVDAVPDFLSLTYYAGDYMHKSVVECPVEMQDTYVRLDEQIGELLEAVEKKVGKDRVLFVLTGTGYSDAEQSADDLTPYRIPTGEFSISKAKLLLNMYLVAVYGQGQYVQAVCGNEIYIDQKLVEKRGLSLNDVLERSASFLIQMSGVKDVFTSQRLMLGASTPGVSELRNAYNPKFSGDILLQIAPGWHLTNEDTDERVLQRDSYLTFPLVFMGAGVRQAKEVTPVTVEHIAPTIASMLRIRAPNGCSASPLSL